jgi:hypothetical protein
MKKRLTLKIKAKLKPNKPPVYLDLGRYGVPFLERYAVPFKLLNKDLIATKSVTSDQAFCGVWAAHFLLGIAQEIDIDLTHKIEFSQYSSYITRTETVNSWEYGVKSAIARFYYVLREDGEARLIYYQLMPYKLNLLTTTAELTTLMVVGARSPQEALAVYSEAFERAKRNPRVRLTLSTVAAKKRYYSRRWAARKEANVNENLSITA